MSDRPGWQQPGFPDWADPIVRRGGDLMPGTGPRARNPRVRGSEPTSGSECADRGFGVPTANPSREPDVLRWLETGVERKRI